MKIASGYFIAPTLFYSWVMRAKTYFKFNNEYANINFVLDTSNLTSYRQKLVYYQNVNAELTGLLGVFLTFFINKTTWNQVVTNIYICTMSIFLPFGSTETIWWYSLVAKFSIFYIFPHLFLLLLQWGSRILRYEVISYIAITDNTGWKYGSMEEGNWILLILNLIDLEMFLKTIKKIE